MIDTDRYAAAVRDWAANGADEPVTCCPTDEVIERSRPRPVEFGLAAAHFELAQHLHRAGFPATRSRTSRRRTASTRRTGATTARR